MVQLFYIRSASVTGGMAVVWAERTGTSLNHYGILHCKCSLNYQKIIWKTTQGLVFKRFGRL